MLSISFSSIWKVSSRANLPKGFLSSLAEIIAGTEVGVEGYSSYLVAWLVRGRLIHVLLPSSRDDLNNHIKRLCQRFGPSCSLQVSTPRKPISPKVAHRIAVVLGKSLAGEAPARRFDRFGEIYWMRRALRFKHSSLQVLIFFVLAFRTWDVI